MTAAVVVSCYFLIKKKEEVFKNVYFINNVFKLGKKKMKIKWLIYL